MKKLFVAFAAVALLTASCEEKTKEEKKEELVEAGEKLAEEGQADDAIEYNDGIVGLQARIMTEMMDFVNFESDDPVADLEGLIATTNECIDELQGIEPYNGGSDMKNAALDLFNFYKETFEGDWMEATKIIAEKGEDMTEEELTHVQNLLTAAGEREKEFDAKFASAQQAFASMHGFDIVRNALQDDIDAMGAE